MNPQLDPSFLRAILLSVSFRGSDVQRGMAYLLLIGLTGRDFSGADLPKEITEGSMHRAGIICGHLTTLDVVDCVGRIKSPHPEARGRKVNVYRIPDNKRSTVKTLLQRWGYPAQEEQQQSLAI